MDLMLNRRSSLFQKCARSYYKVSQSFLVDLFFIGFMLKVAGVDARARGILIPSVILSTLSL